MKKIVIFGNSPAAIQSHYDFTYDSGYEVVAFTVYQSDIKETELLGLPVVPFEQVEHLYPPAEFSMFIAIYFNRVNQVRMKRYTEAKQKGYTLVSYVSSKAVVWPELKIGENCMICDCANIRPFTKLGDNTFVMSGATIGHDAEVKEHCYLAIHAVLLAGAKVESNCVIGSNATILNGVTVAKECVVSAGAVINKDTVEKGIYTVTQPTLLQFSSNKMANVLFKVQV